MGRIANLVREASNNPGTGTFALQGSPAGYLSFVQSYGTGAKVFYVARSSDQTLIEAGIGTVTAATPNTLSRDTVLWNNRDLDNNPQHLAFPGAVDVYSEIPAERAVYLNDDLSLSVLGSLVKKASDFQPLIAGGDGAALGTTNTTQLSLTFTATGPNCFLIAKAYVNYTDTAGTLQSVVMMVTGPEGSTSTDVTNCTAAGGTVTAAGKLVCLISTGACIVGKQYTVTVAFRRSTTGGTAAPIGISIAGFNF